MRAPIVLAAAVAAVAALFYRRRRVAREPLHRTRFRPFKLVERHELSASVRLFVFQVPYGHSLNLPAGKHLQLTFNERDGAQVLRSYTPTETSVPGRFDLLFKVYPNGKMGAYLDAMRVGDRALVRGPTGRVSYSPGRFKVGEQVVACSHILMLAGGTGITPMAQIVKQVLRHAGSDRTRLTLIFASSSPGDVLLYHELAGFAEKHPAQFKLVFVVSRPTTEWAAKTAATGASSIVHESGRLTRELVLRHAPVFIQQRPFPVWAVAGFCGPPGFEACAKGLLESLGFHQPGVNLFRW
ncbi:hypothetical protein KFE25_002823 [Diacronema lutheri]|uniref:FAD-binding FR-type domain-containing protein n=1 Tax=Diacronema lutheri TaxID=2081491 RepID=A0A8J6CBX5_DIALT|nr:hypothetical protein KFE25_002823 [Diacronema lutheri]